MKFQLFLDRQVYHAGETVTGRVEIWRTRSFTTYGCVIELCGLEQFRKKIGSSSAVGVESKQFLSSKLTLGRGPGCVRRASFALLLGWNFVVTLWLRCFTFYMPPLFLFMFFLCLVAFVCQVLQSVPSILICVAVSASLRVQRNNYATFLFSSAKRGLIMTFVLFEKCLHICVALHKIPKCISRWRLASTFGRFASSCRTSCRRRFHTRVAPVA